MPEILIFDWDGNAMGRLRLNKPVITFTVSESFNKIYCTSFTDPEIIFEYDLPEFNENIPMTEIGNSLYSTDILEGYKLAMVSMEEGADKTREVDGFEINLNYFVQERDNNGNGRYDLEAISIGVYKPIHQCANIDAIMKKGNDCTLQSERKITVDGTEVLQTIFSCESLNPNGQIEKLYTCTYIFERSGRTIEISVSSMKNNFSKFHRSMKRTISSFNMLSV